eukprot:gnl/MRDRNA2_/MRDRNA2_77688_c0_seq2.p1 gnl/MRDRNA2_/MRDRNA2_77688_c0~~gnl/MRDRNA2_/MRDRNA2_77688_c0_seq2.p1  ORF type:complete len:892 (-),score=171.25 gnl/MRDRNA2_/MRDRNA2_77688_c0_seq2:240-2915(-)
MSLVKLPELPKPPGQRPSQMAMSNGYQMRKKSSMTPRTSQKLPKPAPPSTEVSTSLDTKRQSKVLSAAQEAYGMKAQEGRRSRPNKPSSPHGTFIPLQRSTNAELAEEIFDLLDVNRDGMLDSTEWGMFYEVVCEHGNQMMAALNPRAGSGPCSGEEGFAAADVDGSNTIAKDEWHSYVKAIVEVVGARQWKKVGRAVFEALVDKQKSGSLLAPHRIAVKSGSTESKNALQWLERDTSAWLQPNADSCVKFSDMTLELLKKYFKMRDVDGSGTLNWNELAHVIDDIGRTPPPGSADESTFELLRATADANGDACFSFNEFIGFLAAYCHAIYERVFMAFDADGSGSISITELEGVLKLLGKAGFEVSWDKVQDLIDSVDSDGNGTLDFTEFCNLMSAYRYIEFLHLKNFSGFPVRRVEGLQHLFESTDVDGSGSLGAREIAALLEKTSLGRSLDTREDLHAFSDLFKRMDRDSSCTLDFEEFLRLLRVWAGGGHVEETQDEQKSQTVCKQSQVRWEKFGDSKEAILDGWAEEFEHDMADEVLSRKWGFPEDEVRTMRDCFEFTDINGSGKIQTSELLPFMEAVGHKVKAGKQQDALDASTKGKNMVDGLEFEEAVEVVFGYEKNLAIMALGGEDQTLKRSALLSALYGIGIFLTPKHAEALFENAFKDDETLSPKAAGKDSATVNHSQFLRVLQVLRSQHMTRWCETCGFRPEFVDKLGVAFTALLPQHGTVDCELALEKVRDLLHKFELIGDSPLERSKMFRAVSRVDRDNSGTMSFEEFLLLVRNFKNKEMYRHQQENEKAMRAHNLENDNGRQLLKVFQDTDNDDDFQITQEDVVSLFKDLGVARKESQQNKVKSCIADWSKGDTGLLVKFPQFLEILAMIEKSGVLD